MRARTKLVSTTILKALPAAPATKVSKPVLFALKMTDLQDPHKKDSPFEAGDPRQRFTPVIATAPWCRGNRQHRSRVPRQMLNSPETKRLGYLVGLLAAAPSSAALDLPTCGRIEARESCRL